MTFFVVATQQRYRIKRRNGQQVTFMFREKPVSKAFKESFATRAGAEVFRELLEQAHIFSHPREIPGRTRYAVVPAEHVGA